MKRTALLLLLFCACALWAAEPAEKRLTGLEKRVSVVEKRVSRLEKAAPSPAETPAAEETKTPVAATFTGKKQVVGKKIGIRLFLELENISRRRLYAFNGLLVFRDEAGAEIWSKAYAYSEPLLPGERVEVALGVSSDQTKEYLRFLKARTITVALEKQEAYGAD